MRERRNHPGEKKGGEKGDILLYIQVDDLDTEVKRLRAVGLKFRNEVITGPGGSQIILDDPSGNPIELFQPKKQ